MYGLIRPLLFRLDAERSHHLTLDSLQAASKLGLTKLLPQPPACRRRRVMGLDFPNPVGLAAGLALAAPARADLVARYEERSRRPMTDIRWYTALALWKSAVFMEGNYRRAVSGASDDEWSRSFGEGVIELAERAGQVLAG